MFQPLYVCIYCTHKQNLIKLNIHFFLMGGNFNLFQ